MGKFKKFAADLRYYARERPSVLIVYLILRLFVLGVLIRSVMNEDYESTFICLLVLILFLVPAFLQDRLAIHLPTTLEIIILCFIFAAEILGELRNYYILYPYWDTLLHTTWGFLCAAVGYSLVDILNRSQNFRFMLSPIFLVIVAFCFSMTIGVLWEFFEFSMDRLLHLDMQKDTVISSFASVTLDETNSNIPIRVDDIHTVAVNGERLDIDGYLDIGLYDTMEDLFVNFLGALTFAILGYLDARGLGDGFLRRRLVPAVKSQDDHADPIAKRDQKTHGR